MGILDYFFSRNQEKPSKKHSYFSRISIDIFSPFLKNYGFSFHRKEIRKYTSNIVWRKGEYYVKISATDFPTDYPYHYNVFIGYGDSEDFFVFDWNSVSINLIAKEIEPKSNYYFDFPSKGDAIESLENSKNQLIKFSLDFLEGDTKVFFEIRNKINGKQEPIRLIKKDENGNEIINFMPKKKQS